VPANIDPIYSKAPDIQWTTIPSGTTANTAGDGTGTVFTVFTADATNGGFVQSIRVKALSTSAATVIRFFINNGSTNATAANNSFTDEMSIPIITATSTAAVSVFELSIGRALPAGYKINCCYATSVTGAIYLTAYAGKY
jgi:hypothetical protein